LAAPYVRIVWCSCRVGLGYRDKISIYVYNPYIAREERRWARAEKVKMEKEDRQALT
jgi:hypothetical protein